MIFRAGQLYYVALILLRSVIEFDSVGTELFYNVQLLYKL